MNKIGQTGSTYKQSSEKNKSNMALGQVSFFCNTCDQFSVLDHDNEGYKIRRSRSSLSGGVVEWQRLNQPRCMHCASIEVEEKGNG